jgi:diacylglycerol kinase (ATP)
MKQNNQKPAEKQCQHKPNGTGIKRIFKAFNCSMLGFKAAFIHESAFRQELLLCLVLLPISFVISESLTTWLALVCSLLFLLFAEVINSALEALADRISTEHHELLGRAKDLGSSGVFIAMIIVSLVWLSAIYQYVKTMF